MLFLLVGPDTDGHLVNIGRVRVPRRHGARDLEPGGARVEQSRGLQAARSVRTRVRSSEPLGQVCCEELGLSTHYPSFCARALQALAQPSAGRLSIFLI